MTDPRLDDVRFLSTPEGQAYLERLNRERDRNRRGSIDPSDCPKCGEWRDSPSADCAACGYAPKGA